MKNKFKLFGIIVLAAVMTFAMTSCGGGGDGPGSGLGPDSGPSGVQTASIKFNLTGAKAVFATEGGSSGNYSVVGRAITDADTLFKILENDSVVPIFEGDLGSMPRVLFIVRSPVPGKKDFYICFENSWWIPGENGNWEDGEVIGQLIHVREDGSIVSIVKNDEPGAWSYIQYDPSSQYIPVSFDQSGNLYFIVGESSNTSYTNVIYKYDPGKGTKQHLTSAVNGISYQKMELSSDGTFIIAKGNRWSNNTSVDFLRYIPTANPSLFENIFYRSGGGGNIYSFVLHPQTKELYMSGYNIYDDGSNNWYSGLYKVSFGGSSSRNDWQWTTVLTNGNYFSWPITYSWDSTINDYAFSWQNVYLNSQGNPDYAKIMEGLYSFFRSDFIEFRYNGKTNEAALASLTQNDLQTINNYNNGQIQFFLDNCFRIGTNTKPTDLSSYSVDMNNIFIVSFDNSVWGSVNSWSGNSSSSIFAKILNGNGQRDFYVPQGMSEKIVISTKASASHLIFIADTTTGTMETGFQNVYGFDFSNPDIIKNFFTNVDGNDRLEVFSFDVGGDYLYFSAATGTSLLTGKVNLYSLEYSQVDFGRKITAMMTY